MSLSDERILDDPAPVEEGLSLRDELASALSAGSASDGPSGATPPASEAAAAKPTPTPTVGAQPRAADGKFAPASATPTPEPNAQQASAAPAEGQAPTQTSGPPPSWSAAAKAEFANASPVIQQEVLKRERDMETGKAQWQSGAERLNRLDVILAPHRSRMAISGASEEQTIASFFAAEDALRNDPVNAIAHLARVYGVDLRGFAAQGQGQQQPQAQLPPALQALVSEVQTLKGALAQQQQSQVQAQRSEYVNHVTAFAADPANLYFENVREPMAALLKSGQAKDLADAYQKATWSDPEIRPHLLAKQQETAQAQTSEAARAKAAQARHASGSVTGSPAPGATPGRTGPAPTLRDELVSAFAQHA